MLKALHPQHRKDLPLKAAERHQLRKRSFDATAQLYDEFRPGYPEPLFDDLVELTGIPKDGRILEIGPGTGQATLPLARRGFSILGLELGASMARLCRKNLTAFPNVEILTTSFEDWTGKTETVPSQGSMRRGQTRGEFDAAAPDACPLGGTVPALALQETTHSARPVIPSESDESRNLAQARSGQAPALRGALPRLPCAFDLILAATAFHWIPAKLAFPRCARVLKPSGSLALLWNFVDMPDTRFYRDLQAIYRRIAPRMRLSLPPELRIERQRKKIVSSGHFGPVTVLRYPWQSEYTADRYIGLLKTMSDHAILAPQVRRDIFRAIRRLIDDNGGSFTRPVIAVLFLTPKR